MHAQAYRSTSCTPCLSHASYCPARAARVGHNHLPGMQLPPSCTPRKTVHVVLHFVHLQITLNSAHMHHRIAVSTSHYNAPHCFHTQWCSMVRNGAQPTVVLGIRLVCCVGVVLCMCCVCAGNVLVLGGQHHYTTPHCCHSSTCSAWQHASPLTSNAREPNPHPSDRCARTPLVA
jgi:hypothetical protein